MREFSSWSSSPRHKRVVFLWLLPQGCRALLSKRLSFCKLISVMSAKTHIFSPSFCVSLISRRTRASRLRRVSQKVRAPRPFPIQVRSFLITGGSLKGASPFILGPRYRTSQWGGRFASRLFPPFGPYGLFLNFLTWEALSFFR